MICNKDTQISPFIFPADIFVKRLGYDIQQKDLMKHVEFFGTIGSWVNDARSSLSDYDILLITKEESTYLGTFENYDKIISLISEIQHNLYNEGVLVQIFSYFLQEEFYFGYARENALNYNLLHLLAYPGIKKMVKWESSSFLNTISFSNKPIIGSITPTIISNLSSKYDVNHYLQLLYRYYAIMNCSPNIPRIVLLTGTLGKLQYALKHATRLLLESNGIFVKNWNEILKTPLIASNENYDLLKIVHQLYSQNQNKTDQMLGSINNQYMRNLYKRGILYIHKIENSIEMSSNILI